MARHKYPASFISRVKFVNNHEYICPLIHFEILSIFPDIKLCFVLRLAEIWGYSAETVGYGAVIKYLALNPCTSLIRAITSLRVLSRLRAKMVAFQRFHSLGGICRGLESMMSVVVGVSILKSRVFLNIFCWAPYQAGTKEKLSGQLEKRIAGSSH